VSAPQFKYDVALSFLDARDEALATRLADALRERFEVFVYTERQRELVGRDGVEAFAGVFGKEARVIVVLYREEWGTTKWTRVEQDAIRNRAFELGWDFTVFVPMDEAPKMPPWLPRTRLYHGMKRFGLDGACAVIEQRIAEAGGEPREATVADVAANKVRERERERKRAEFRRKPAVDWALAQVQDVPEAVQRLVGTVSELGLHVERSGEQCVEVWHENGGPVLTVGWYHRYINSLDGAALGACLWRIHPRSPEAMFEEPKQKPLHRDAYVPDLGHDGEPTWVDSVGRPWTLAAILDEALKRLVRALPATDH
jgi:hypothetical protein